MGQLVKADSTMFRSWFKEMAKLLGIRVIYQYPIDMKFTIYAEENPKITTLRKYGWVSEIPDDKPYLAQLPFDAKNLCKGCRISIIPPLPLADKRVFVITDIQSNLQFPDSWMCKLAPVFFEKTENKLDYKDKNNVFMNLED